MRSELYLNGTLVDLKEEIDAALTLQIADIRDPKSRNGSYSKTVKLPGTKTLNALLSMIFEIAHDIQTSGVVNFTPDFNPNLKCTAVLYVDSCTQFRGYMWLKSIARDQQDHSRLYYNVNLIGEVKNVFLSVEDKKLTDLSFSEYNHTYNKANQKATWTNTNYGTGYVYPMINYGGVTASTWAVEDFKPAIYLKTFVDKIINGAGFSYTSTFLNSNLFKRFIIPFCGERLTISAAQSTARLFSAYTSVDTSGVVGTVDPVIFNAETNDPSNQYDTGTGFFTVANSGYYDFYSSGVVTLDAISSVTGGGSVTLFIDVVTTRGASVSSYNIVSDASFSSVATYSSGAVIKVYNYQSWSQTLPLLAGDTVNIKRRWAFNLGWTGTVGVKLSSGAVFFNRITNASILDGGLLDMQTALPVDIKQADLLSSVFRTFNLYLEPDKNNPYNLIIDTYDDFYGSGTVKDWTLKVDSSKPVLVQPMGLLDARRYKLKYTNDSDYWNKYYTDKWNESYGEKNLDIINDFLKNTNTNEVIFSPTPSIGSSSHDRIIPEIYQLGNSGVQTATRSKLRLLYWGGEKATVNSWSYTSSVAGTSTETTYPYSGHIDDPISPTLDLSFGVPREIYYVNPYGQTSYTNNNIYNAYHSKFLSEITDRNSKLVTLYVRLRPLDINNLSFRDKIFIDGHYYRLQKVIDYNPVAEVVTKVELLKIKEGVPFSPVVQQLTFTAQEMIDIDSRSPSSGGNIGIGDVLNTSQNLTVGSNNYVSTTARGVVISGSSNRVGNNASNISILNSSGVAVLDGLENVSVINTNDITVEESNVSYQDGLRVASSVIHTTSSSQTITSLGVWECNGPLTLTLATSFFRTGDSITVKRIGGGVSISGGGINIDGAATYTLSAIYDSVTIYYNGTVYYTLAR